MKIAIVSLADKNYFHLLNELIDSINYHPESNSVDICILDGGLDKDQLQIIEKKVHKIKKPKLNFKIDRWGIKNKPYLEGICARLFLRDIFPDHDKYIWIDSDAWINSWIAIDHLLKASSQGKLAVSSMSDRHTSRVLRVKWIFKNLAIVKSQNFKHSSSSGFSLETSRFVGLQPHLNAGVFCLDKDSVFWEAWLKNFLIAIKKGRVFGSDQIALNVTVYRDKHKVDIVPYYCNWIPNIKNTKYNNVLKKFVEGYTPHHEIGIMHLAGGVFVNNKDMRFDKNILGEIFTTEGQLIKKSFRFSFK